MAERVRRSSTGSAQIAALLVVLLGFVLILSQPLATTLDGFAGMPVAPLAEKTVITTVTDETPGAPPRTTRTETTERATLPDRSVTTRLLELPGATFLSRLGLVLLVALIAGAFVQSIVRGRFAVGVAGISVESSASEEVSRALAVIRADPALAPARAADDRSATPPNGRAQRARLDPSRASTPSAAGAPPAAVYRAVPVPEGLRRTLAAARRATERRYRLVADPRVAVLTLRTDLEQRIRVLGELYGIGGDRLAGVIAALERSGHISAATAQAMNSILDLAAVVEADAAVPADVIKRIRRSAPEVLDRLDELVFGQPRGDVEDAGR